MELNPLIQNSVQQNYLSELYPQSYQKSSLNPLVLLVVPTRCGLSCPFPQTFGGNPIDGGMIPHSCKKFLISRTGKIPLTKQKFSCSHPIQASFKAVFISVIWFFLTAGFIFTYIMLILINWWLLNLIFSMTKALNGQSSSKQNFHPPLSTHFNTFWKTLLQSLVVFLVTPSLFHFKLYKFLRTPLQIRLHSLQTNQI